MRLRTQALGTYLHSLLVGQMAAFAASFLPGVDPLLTFIGGQYHDVGKLIRSSVYAENAFLKPQKKDDFLKNQLFIARHTERSLALAKQYGIPAEVQAFMVSHHGTTVAFKHSKSVRSLKQKPFRYAGPKPQMMEEVLVMLADSCEASFRAHSPWKLTLLQMEKLFTRVIAGKVSEGQLEDVVYKPSVLKMIAKRFALLLRANYHIRQT